MKFPLGPRAVVVAALTSFAVVGCNPPMDEPKANPPASTPRSSGRGKSAPAPTPDEAKPAPDVAKPADSAPAPKDDSKKEEPPK
jgi:hypothetical protein